MTKHPEKNHQYQSAFEKMHMYAIKDRAALLRELGYSAAEVKNRIKEDVKWENEGFKLPDYYSQIDKIVDYIFV